MIKLAPSILAADFSKLEQEIKTVSEAEYLHIDVMDGEFVPNISFGPPILKAIADKTDHVMDVHLMINRPARYIDDFAAAGADIIGVHAESTLHLHRILQQIKSHNLKAAVALNPATPITEIEHVLNLLDMVLIMSVNPGFGGQKFIPATLDKIKRLRELIEQKDLAIDIQVDGGIKPNTTASEAIKAGANILVAGSAIFKAEDRTKAIKDLKNS